MKLVKESEFSNPKPLLLLCDNRLYDFEALKAIKDRIYRKYSHREIKHKALLSFYRNPYFIYPVYSFEDNNIILAIFILKKIRKSSQNLSFSIYLDRSAAEKLQDDPNSTLIHLVTHDLSGITPRSQVATISFKRKRIYKNFHPLIVKRESFDRKMRRIREKTFLLTRKIERNRLEFLHNRISALKDHLSRVEMVRNTASMDQEKERDDLQMENSLKMSAVARRHSYFMTHRAYHFSAQRQDFAASTP